MKVDTSHKTLFSTGFPAEIQMFRLMFLPLECGGDSNSHVSTQNLDGIVTEKRQTCNWMDNTNAVILHSEQRGTDYKGIFLDRIFHEKFQALRHGTCQ